MNQTLPNRQTFGYRSIVFRVVVLLIFIILLTYFAGGTGFFIALLIGVYTNFDGIDTMKVTLDDDKLHVTRYVPLTEYDCTFWLKDIEEVGIYLRVKAGKTTIKGGLAAGGKASTLMTWQQIHVILKDGREHKIMLLGMLGFERDRLKRALKQKGIKSFEIGYRIKDGHTLNP